MKITYWSDYACPYCYIGEKRLEKVIEELNLQDVIELEMKSFELDPGAPRDYHGTTVERFARKYMLSEKRAADQIEHISKLGKEEGIDFRYADTRYTNTLDAHRLTKLVQSKGDQKRANQLVTDLFDAYFTRNQELTDRELLIELGVKAGIDRGEIEELLDGDLYEKEVRADEAEAQRVGVRAVPFFVIDHKYSISGARPKEAFMQALQAIAEEQKTEIFPQGASCGIDGCH
ncbi:MAG: DsbA family oxidoreductase [Eubacteriales bacterium]|nr:DsbA family oxidoreductase [Eubacteriales bacterium]